ncbi:MAG: vanadium-dependent haloperoxidase, partial [bacterium]
VDSSAFELEAQEVYDTVNEIRLAGPTDERFVIADFWADNPGPTATPPGHWISIASIVLDAENADLGTAAETYARLGIAVSDAFISCWYTKYQTNLIRPISYIQNVSGPINDPAWVTLTPTPTPPFPEYTSGHSVQSGAASRVLEAMFGTAYAFVDDTHANRNPPLSPRSFSSFAAAADEAAVSRLYGGIHYRAAIDLGVQQGRLIGDLVNDIPFRR